MVGEGWNLTFKNNQQEKKKNNQQDQLCVNFAWIWPSSVRPQRNQKVGLVIIYKSGLYKTMEEPKPLRDSYTHGWEVIKLIIIISNDLSKRLKH